METVNEYNFPGALMSQIALRLRAFANFEREDKNDIQINESFIYPDSVTPKDYEDYYISFNLLIYEDSENGFKYAFEVKELNFGTFDRESVEAENSLIDDILNLT